MRCGCVEVSFVALLVLGISPRGFAEATPIEKQPLPSTTSSTVTATSSTAPTVRTSTSSFFQNVRAAEEARREREGHFVGDIQDASSASTVQDLDDSKDGTLAQIAAYDLTFQITPYAWIRPDGLLQLRSTTNFRSDPTTGKRSTVGFSIPRARFGVWAGVSEHLRFRMRIGVSSGGQVNLEQGFADAAFGPVTVRVGRFWLPIYWGGGPAPTHLTKTEYSLASNYLDGGQTQGGSIAWATPRVQLRAYFGDGVRTGFAEFGQQLKADFAGTLRVDLNFFTDHGWGRFDEFSSFRGSDFALRFGAAFHAQRGGDTGETDPLGYLIGTADVQLEGDGWHIFAAGGWARQIVLNVATFENFAMEAQTGYFVFERLEVWLSYSGLFADGQAQPPGLGAGTGETDLHAFSGGLAWFVLPRAHRGKLQLQLDHVRGAIDTSLIGPSSNNGLLDSTAGYAWTGRLQLTVAF